MLTGHLLEQLMRVFSLQTIKQDRPPLTLGLVYTNFNLFLPRYEADMILALVGNFVVQQHLNFLVCFGF
jgi:hypothetical protein